LIPIQERLVNVVLKMIQRQRDGESVNVNLLKNVIDSLVVLGMDDIDHRKPSLIIYKNYFETQFIQDTSTYYKNASGSFIDTSTVPEYLVKALAWIDSEGKRLEEFLHPSTAETLISTVDILLVKDHAEFVQDAFQGLLDGDRQEDLIRMYQLLCRIPSTLDKLKVIFEAHVLKQGLLAVEAAFSKSSDEAPIDDEDLEEPATPRGKRPTKKSDEIDPKVFTDALLIIHKKYQALTDTAFSGESGFVASLDKACEEFVNRNAITKDSVSKTPELLAKYTDTLLRKGSKGVEESEIEERLNGIVVVAKIDDSIQVCRRKRCFPKVLLQEFGKTSSKWYICRR
jgi:cullin 1